MVLISQALLAAGQSDRGSWSKRQLQLLGVSYPLQSGWRQKILGQEISEQAAQDFVALKNQHLKPQDRQPQLVQTLPSVATTTPAPSQPPSAQSTSQPVVVAYTDGACSGNPGPGGWGAVMIWPGDRQEELSGSAIGATTNNRMEMQAAIEVLKALPPGSTVRLHSDSQLLINTMTRGWKRKANQDLWAELDRLVALHQVDWVWVKGHASDPLNNRADALAVAGARRA
ncbi:MAG: ribonuclease HI [Spirulinaceae cyanobacterium RM2_2_10]|nr:ribonuclease HI [Spirulinaceae cyanobacterium SM2_1_0]NJO20947.1 ribonuclease HI [Spirulinaceae cyanobacterium RM2_2_10]